MLANGAMVYVLVGIVTYLCTGQETCNRNKDIWEVCIWDKDIVQKKHNFVKLSKKGFQNIKMKLKTYLHVAITHKAHNS